MSLKVVFVQKALNRRFIDLGMTCRLIFLHCPKTSSTVNKSVALTFKSPTSLHGLSKNARQKIVRCTHNIENGCKQNVCQRERETNMLMASPLIIKINF